MTWSEILGHDSVLAKFRAAEQRGRLAGTFLFVGPAGIGKRTFAFKLAQALLCANAQAGTLEPCGRCSECRQVAANSHPDLLTVSRPADKAFIPLSLLIGDDDERMRAGLCYDIALKPFGGKRRIAILDDVDYLNNEGANCLLKTLEEPPPQSVVILVGTSEQRQLPTIRSRCRVIRFRPLADEQVASLLQRQRLCDDSARAAEIASQASGSLARAIELLDDALLEFRRELRERLSQKEFETSEFAKITATFIETAGKDGAAKRARFHQAIDLAAEFYRELLTALVTEPAVHDSHFREALARALRWWPGGEEGAIACLERCFEAHAAVDANANQATLLECWYDDLAQTSRLGRAP